MPFKINISNKEGKTYKIELESEALVGKETGDKIDGKEILPALEGYELEITGASDKAGFASMPDIEGIALKKVLLTYGKNMKKRPKHEGKHTRSNNRPKGLRLRKTVRGRVISPAIVQINMKVVKEGSKPIAQAFPDQNKTPEAQIEKPAEKPVEAPAQ
ncbi:MAG: 30S ribosomal protein S6e [Nanoarchaeota archaeon]|nr:30S ribosomal protein S6e [Nanoarchaeota archaeon]